MAAAIRIIDSPLQPEGVVLLSVGGLDHAFVNQTQFISGCIVRGVVPVVVCDPVGFFLGDVDHTGQDLFLLLDQLQIAENAERLKAAE